MLKTTFYVAVFRCLLFAGTSVVSIALIIITGCSREQSGGDIGMETFLTSNNQTALSNVTMPASNIRIVYPYVASEFRTKQILDGSSSLKAGMSASQVVASLGEPDEVHLTYSGIKAGTSTGRQFVYLLRRDQPMGSRTEKNEKSIRVHFDTNGALDFAFPMNLESFKEIRKEGAKP